MDYKPRLLEDQVERYLNMDKSVVVVGPRQAGKTYLLRHLSTKWNGLYINCEELGAKEFLLSYDGERLLFLDETQRLPQAGRILKLLHDRGKRFVATGSGSFDIKVKISGELVGRAKRLVLLPLSFEEFILWKRPEILDQYRRIRDWVWSDKSSEPPFREHPTLELLWKEYMRFGGYPEVVKRENKEEILSVILENYVDKDIVADLGVRSREAFINVLRVVAASLGTPLSKNKIAETVGINYRTVDHYLSLLRETFLIFDVPQRMGVVESLRKRKKFYFVDVGVYNWLIRDFRSFDIREDSGKLLENYVARVLFERGVPFYFYRTPSGEVDFLTKNAAIEAKMGGRVPKLLRKFADKGKKALLITPDRLKERKGILIVPPWFL